MGLDIMLEKQNINNNFEVNFYKEPQLHKMSVEDVIKLEEFQNKHYDSLREFITLKSSEIITTMKYSEFMEEFYRVWKLVIEGRKNKEFVPRIKAKNCGMLSYYMEEYNLDDSERFFRNLVTLTHNSFSDGDKGYSFGVTEIGLFNKGIKPNFYKSSLYSLDIKDFIIDSIGSSDDVGTDRSLNKVVFSFIEEDFKEFEYKFTPLEKSFMYMMETFSFYNSNEPWTVPLMFIIQLNDMFKKYKPEFLKTEVEKEYYDWNTVGEMIENMIENQLEFVAG